MATSWLPDLTPLRVAPYRRLYTGLSLAAIGTQLAVVAIGLQVYDLTGSTAAVGVVGLAALVPLLVMGLYGGALADHYDRRRVGLVASLVSLAASLVAAAQAWLDSSSVLLLYAVAAVWSGSQAVSSPARTSIYPRLLEPALLPAANALAVFAMNGSMTVGPLLAGFLIDGFGYRAAYTLDAVLTLGALWGFGRLPPVLPEDDGAAGTDGGRRRRVGLRSVLDGLVFLRTAPNVRMTFIADIAAMLLAQPRVLFPAAGAVILGGGAATVGALYAATAIGGVAAMGLSGRFGGVRRQGTAILVSIVGWGAGIAGLGLALLTVGGLLSRQQALVAALLAMGVAGASDAVSAVFRGTILQVAAPDRMRGRLQGVFIVVVAGGPRLGELLGGAVAEGIGEGWTAVLGGLACIAAMGVLALVQPGFRRYDARDPRP